jgi:hypothetical protein
VSDDALFKPTITLCFDPNDGTHGLFIDGILALDSDDEDVTPTGGMDFWRDALASVVEALGGTLVEECRYRPSQRFGIPGEEEWESFWPQFLKDMGPLEPPFEPEEPRQDEENHPAADWNLF